MRKTALRETYTLSVNLTYLCGMRYEYSEEARYPSKYRDMEIRSCADSWHARNCSTCGTLDA